MTRRGRDYIPALDGLRAVAVGLVIAFHFAPDAVPGGFLGVDLFFVISGFVITRLLLLERAADGSISLTRFWTRRARRLLPAVLAVILAAQVWSHHEGATSITGIVRGESWSSLLYVSNWWTIFAKVGYFDGSFSSSPLNHLWSLAIEEQFYLVWPVLMLVFLSKPRVMAGVTGVLLVASAALQLLHGDVWSLDRLYLGTDTRAFALLGGALLAQILIPESSGSPSAMRQQRLDRRTSAVSSFVALACLAGLVGAALRTQLDSASLFRGQLLLITFVEVLLVAFVVLARGSALARVLGSRPFTFVGERSYSLYLWHWSVLAIVTTEATRLSGFELAVLRIVLIAVLSQLSFALIENPIRHSTIRGARLIAVLTVVVVALGTFAVTYHPAQSARQMANRVTSTVVRAGQGKATVLVVGDSWARNLGVGMVNVDDQATVVNMGLGGCGIADPTAYRTSDRGTFATPPQCLDWPQTWASAIAAHHPDAAVLTVGNWDQAEGQIDGAWVRPGDPVFDSAYAQKLDQAIQILSRHDVAVYMTTVIPGSDPALKELSDAMNALLRSAADRHENVRLLDLGDFLCPSDECQSVRDGADVFDDTGHLAPTWQDNAAAWVLNDVYQHVGSQTG